MLAIHTMKYILIIFLFCGFAFPLSADNPDKHEGQESEGHSGQGQGGQGHDSDEHSCSGLRSNLKTYYQLEDELLQQLGNHTNIANISMEGSHNSANVTQDGLGHFENTMIWGNHNQVEIQQLGPVDSYSSVFMRGNHNLVDVKQ